MSNTDNQNVTQEHTFLSLDQRDTPAWIFYRYIFRSHSHPERLRSARDVLVSTRPQLPVPTSFSLRLVLYVLSLFTQRKNSALDDLRVGKRLRTVCERPPRFSPSICLALRLSVHFKHIDVFPSAAFHRQLLQ